MKCIPAAYDEWDREKTTNNTCKKKGNLKNCWTWKRIIVGRLFVLVLTGRKLVSVPQLYILWFWQVQFLFSFLFAFLLPFLKGSAQLIWINWLLSFILYFVSNHQQICFRIQKSPQLHSLLFSILDILHIWGSGCSCQSKKQEVGERNM